MKILELPYFTGAVKAGFPSPAMDYMEERIDLNDVYIKHPSSTILIDITGDSMINAFRTPARGIVDRSVTPQNGDIILVSINGEFTVKFLKKNEYKCWLIPANKKYKEIEVTPEMDMRIFGVVTTIVTLTKDLNRCML